MKKVRFSFSPHGARSPAATEAADRVFLAAKEVKQLRDGSAGTRVGDEPQPFWAAPRPVEPSSKKLRSLFAPERHFRRAQAPDPSALSLAGNLSELHLDLEDTGLDSVCKFAQDSSSSPPPYLCSINNFFKSEKLTKAEMKLKENMMVEMMKLNKQIKQTQTHQVQLLEENRQLYTEKELVQAENKLFLEYLTDQTEEYRRQPQVLWNNYLQKTREIEQRRQESASSYAEHMSVLKTELLQKEKIQHNLKQQLQAMRGILMVKEKQVREIQALREGKKKVQAETEAKIQEFLARFLQEKALLEKQLSEHDLRLLEKRNRKVLNRKNRALELMAKQYAFKFYSDMERENQRLQKELLQLTQQCQEMQVTRRQLKTRKQHLQQEQWYAECLMRQRQRMQRRQDWCPPKQGPPKTTMTPPLGTKPRVNPK